MAEKNTADKELSTSRIFNAPVELVWKMWSEPVHLARWWGPKGFRNTFQQHEFKVGGHWKFTMHGPNGQDYQNEILYVEIEKHHRIVLEHTSPPCFRVTATFEKMGDRTKVTFHQAFRTAEHCNSVKDYAIMANEENFARMDAELAPLSGALLPKEFVLTRTFDAPVEVMWKMWTDPEHMGKWWGPKEVKVGQSKMDFRRGGTYHYSMLTPDGGEMWGKFYYRDIVKNKRLLYVGTFSDKNGGLGRHPFAPEWPAELLSQIDFEEKNGKTEVTIRWYPINATENEIKVFNEGHGSMTQGWGGSLDRLESTLRAR